MATRSGRVVGAPTPTKRGAEPSVGNAQIWKASIPVPLAAPRSIAQPRIWQKTETDERAAPGQELQWNSPGWQVKEAHFSVRM